MSSGLHGMYPIETLNDRLRDHTRRLMRLERRVPIVSAGGGGGTDLPCVTCSGDDLSVTGTVLLSGQPIDDRFVNVTGDTMTGPLVIPGPPTLDGQAANKAYVDAEIGALAGFLPPGGTTGQHLAKIDGTDYNAEWVDPEAGGGGGTQDVLWVGPDAPTDPIIELWWDTDETPPTWPTLEEADLRYVNVDGDTMTGPLTVTGPTAGLYVRRVDNPARPHMVFADGTGAALATIIGADSGIELQGANVKLNQAMGTTVDSVVRKDYVDQRIPTYTQATGSANVIPAGDLAERTFQTTTLAAQPVAGWLFVVGAIFTAKNAADRITYTVRGNGADWFQDIMIDTSQPIGRCIGIRPLAANTAVTITGHLQKTAGTAGQYQTYSDGRSNYISAIWFPNR